MDVTSSVLPVGGLGKIGGSQFGLAQGAFEEGDIAFVAVGADVGFHWAAL